MTATQRPLTGRSSEFADVLELVAKVDLVGDQTDVTFSGLDGDADVKYLLEMRVPCGAGGTAHFSLQPNGLNTNLTDAGGQFNNGAATGFANTTTGQFGYVLTGQIMAATLKIWAKSGLKRVWCAEFTGNAPLIAITGSTWDDLVTNITSLVIHSDVANSIGAGSSFTLYRMPNG